MSYQLLDSGNGRKFERFGEFRLVRPCPQAVWRPQLSEAEWAKADSQFQRDEKSGGWKGKRPLPASWEISVEGVRMQIAPTEFGHLGFFPEHAAFWKRIRDSRAKSVLNLFAYSGGATIAAAQSGASVCHVDASKGMTEWARDNAARNQLTQAPIRWIVDDACKFLKREVKRGNRYEGILLDPPTFGRGAQGEVFKIEEEVQMLLELCRELLAPEAKFFFLSCHTPGFTPLVLRHLWDQMGLTHMKHVETGEMALTSPGALSIPSGSYCYGAS